MKSKRPTSPWKELLKYIASGVLIAGLWAGFGGIEWNSPSDRAAASEAELGKAALRTEISELRNKINSAENPAVIALAVEDLKKAETKLAAMNK